MKAGLRALLEVLDGDCDCRGWANDVEAILGERPVDPEALTHEVADALGMSGLPRDPRYRSVLDALRPGPLGVKEILDALEAAPSEQRVRDLLARGIERGHIWRERRNVYVITAAGKAYLETQVPPLRGQRIIQ